MDERFPVQIEPMQRVGHSFEALFYCRKCSSYTSLPEDGCKECGGNKLISFNTMVDRIFKRTKRMEIFFLINLFLVLILLAGYLFPMSLNELLISFLVFIICLLGLVAIQKHFKEDLRTFELTKILKAESQTIKSSLEEDRKLINNNLLKGDYLLAYKQLRALGIIVKTSYIKENKLRCLNRFVIRSDMPLEMDDLLLPSYDRDLVVYIYELSKVQRNLIKQPTIDYMIEHEELILNNFDNANIILGNIAGAAFYSKSKLELNKDFILRYIEEISQDRLVRMEKLITSNHNYDWTALEEALGVNLKGVTDAEI